MVKEKFTDWTTEQVAAFLSGIGLDTHVKEFQDNDILGSHLPLLDRDDLKSLGVDSLGRRLLLMKEISTLKAKERLQQRKEIISKHTQAWDGSCWSRNCSTCCGLFPWDPDKYILTAGNLRKKHYEVFRLCGIFRMTCCGGKWTNDNIPLNKIVDVDAKEYFEGVCCFKENKVLLKLKGVAGNDAETESSRLQDKELLVEGDVGIEFQKQIRNQIEEYKLIVGMAGKVD